VRYLSLYRLIGKMALPTWVAAWSEKMLVPALIVPVPRPNFPQVLAAGLIAAGIVVILTWVAMPLLVRVAHGWLYPKNKVSQYS
jgi:uncharacterized protein